jgi:hypothetical protein
VSSKGVDQPFNSLACHLILGFLVLPNVNITLACGSDEIPKFREHQHIDDFFLDISDIFYFRDSVTGQNSLATWHPTGSPRPAPQLIETNEILRPGNDDLIFLVNTHAFAPWK